MPTGGEHPAILILFHIQSKPTILSPGGYNREECLRTVECYDPRTDHWSFLAPMRTPRARFQMAVLMVSTVCAKQPFSFVFSLALPKGDSYLSLLA